MSIFDSGAPSITLAFDIPFPSNVVSGSGIAVSKTSSVWSVNLDTTSLTDGGIPGTPSNIYLAGYDTALLRYEKLRLDNIIAGATGLDARTPRGDADYSILVGDRYIGLTAALTAVRTWTLPAASTVPGGRVVTIQDEAGGIAGANYLTFAPTGADTINGVAGNYLLKAKFGGLAFRSDGTSKWNVIFTGQRRAVADAAYVALQGDSIVAYTSISAARVVTLPAASAFPQGMRLTVVDESGSCSLTSTITLARAGADTINGATSQLINQAFGYLALVSDGTSKWTIVDASTVTPVQVVASRTVVGDAAYAVLSTDRYVVTSTAFTAPRTWTLPAASAVPAGTAITFEDVTNAASTTNTLTVSRAGADTINVAGTTVVIGSGSRQGFTIRSDGVSNWNRENTFLSGIDGSTIGGTTPGAGSFTTLTANSLAINSGAPSVGGRISITAGGPAVLTTIAAATSVFWFPYLGCLVPLWNGAQFVWTPVAALTNVLANSAVGNAGPAAAAASQVYDLYIWLNAGVPTLTRGPAWSAGTGGSNTVRGTGAGGSAQSTVNGVIVNTVAITNGPGAAAGTYVGTVATDSGGGTVSWSTGSAAANGGAATLNVWNAYNRLPVAASVQDTTATWAYSTTTFRAANASNTNRISMVIGLSESMVWAEYSVFATNTSAPQIGVGVDSTSSVSGRYGSTSNGNSVDLRGSVGVLPGLGVHFLQAVEKGNTGVTFFGGAAPGEQQLLAHLVM